MMWSVPREWDGDTAFIVANGPSFTEPERIEGRRVIAINSGWESVPFADYLFFGDQRWWGAYGAKAAASFAGKIVNCSRHNGSRWVHKYPPGVLRLIKRKPPGLASDPRYATMSRTSVTGAVNLAVHLGVARIVIVGLDGKLGPDGKRHHHGVQYPWRMKADAFAAQRAELASIVPDLKSRGVTVLNANRDSLVECFPFTDLEDVL